MIFALLTASALLLFILFAGFHNSIGSSEKDVGNPNEKAISESVRLVRETSKKACFKKMEYGMDYLAVFSIEGFVIRIERGIFCEDLSVSLNGFLFFKYEDEHHQYKGCKGASSFECNCYHKLFRFIDCLKAKNHV